MKPKIYPLVLLMFFMLLSACSMSNPFGGDPLDGTTWELLAISGSPPAEGSHITISFDNGQVGGNSGCNHYGGEYQVRGDRIEFGMLSTTLMACADPIMMDQESIFTRFLGEAGKFEIVDGQLQVYGAGDESLTFISMQTSYP